ncbi:MAG: type II toxin-antitoxin system YoeB family toxin [Thermodesulfovibrionales bacterium]|nr:type II toxin-antitoxin system YoeB family toxin [Thermodesulfovibrionales bacterium]
MPYDVRFSKVAFKDVGNLSPRLKKKLRELIEGRLAHNPYAGKKLMGDLAGFFSLRLSFKDRVVYSVDEKRRIIFIHRAKTHYGE